tara:strand:- start:887 stop:1087 length:201 start_codon:yes stop_codon:yes gene_type:complete
MISRFSSEENIVFMMKPLSLQAWVEDHYRDFEQDQELTAALHDFINGEMQNLMEKSGTNFTDLQNN